MYPRLPMPIKQLGSIACGRLIITRFPREMSDTVNKPDLARRCRVHVIYAAIIVVVIVAGLLIGKEEQQESFFSYQSRYHDDELIVDSSRPTLGIPIMEYMVIRKRLNESKDEDRVLILIDALLDLCVLDSKDRLNSAPRSARSAIMGPLRRLAEFREEHPRLIPAAEAEAAENDVFQYLHGKAESDRKEVDDFLAEILRSRSAGE